MMKLAEREKVEEHRKNVDHELDNLDTPELTREQWIELCSTKIDNNKLPDDYWSVFFNSISESKLLLKSFNLYSEDQQILLVQQLDSVVPLHTVESYIRLCNQAGIVNSRLKGCANFRFFEMAEILETVIGSPSEQLQKSMQRVLYSTDHLSNQSDKSWPGMLDAVILLIRVVHGEEKLIYVFDSWIDSMGWLDPYCLIQLVEKWDQVSEMPISWAVQWVIDSDSV